MKVLVADDDPDQLSLRSMLLERSGFQTMGAADPVSAAELAASQKPECAVIDLRLPTEERGLWLISELKTRPCDPHYRFNRGQPRELRTANGCKSSGGNCRERGVFGGSDPKIEVPRRAKLCVSSEGFPKCRCTRLGLG
jgi:CheY-like chemotaxis protein